ncbi:hypothetical protein FOA52_008079 [Chlamydomonas sp. UWO 241]|nr:hypothetical protein FOA52_008079 [Chlamydomonas sp. UWO 241]
MADHHAKRTTCGPLTTLMDWLMASVFMSQFCALYKKNYLVAVRNYRATLLRLIAPFLFLVLALVIDKAIQANDSRQDNFADMTTPNIESIGVIPSCHDDLYIGSNNCTELLYSPDNAITRAIMGNVTSRNAVPITASPLASQDAVNAYLLAYTDNVIAAVQFVFEDPSSPTQLSGFLLQTNTTVKFWKGTFQNPNTFVQLPLQSAVQREIARYTMATTPALAGMADGLAWDVGIAAFPHPTLATTSVLGQVLGPFVFAAVMFAFVSQMGFLIMEKEAGLRQALTSMGCTASAYWTSYLMWELSLALLSANLICCFGLLLQFDLFLNNNYGLLFFLFFLFQLSMSSLAMFVCAFIRKSQVSVYIGFAIFMIGWIMQVVVTFGVPYTPDFYYDFGSAITIIFSLFPWCLLAKGFQDLGAATVSATSPGLQWADRYSYCKNIPNTADQPDYNPREEYISFDCVMPLGTIYIIYFILWIGYFVLAIYFDAIIPNEYGVRQPFWYPLLPSYWAPERFAKASALSKIDDGMGPDGEAGADRDEDVAEEEARMRELLMHRTGAAGTTTEMAGKGANLERNAVEVFGLKRVFPYVPCAASCGGCCCAFGSSKDARAFWAIKGSWIGIPENQLFCLLGPNGAGKSTTINCLTGVLPASNGEALVYGHPVTSAASMGAVRSMMGVCPQFDVLWGELSGREHLQIYGSIKGISWKSVAGEADDLMERVKLTYAAAQRTSAYSGGMKRRLSVAIALLGNPKIVYLDEPTTGMDPISRRYVWDIIQEAKVGRAIVLTTHSMEEADILGDRIAIMAKGRLRCIGSSLRLKQRFGSGYQVSVCVQPPVGTTSRKDLTAAADDNVARVAALKDFFRDNLKGLEAVEESKAYIQYLVPRDMEDELQPFLRKLEAEGKALGVTDVQLSLTSLEEVFLNIAKAAELEEAARNGDRKPVDVLLPDGTTLQVPIGSETVINPATGAAYKLLWTTDETGNLRVAACTALEGAAAAAAVAATAAAAAAGASIAVAAASGTADVQLDDGTMLRVGHNQQYVMNPVTKQPYELVWGVGPDGRPRVVSIEPYVAGGSNSGEQQHSAPEPRAPSMLAAQPGQPASYFNVQASSGPNAALPGSVPSSGQRQRTSEDRREILDMASLANRLPPSAQGSFASRASK